MNCSECIYGYYYNECNADWNNDEYEKMIQSHECKFYDFGHQEYLKVTKEKGG